MKRVFVYLLIVATMGLISACDSVDYPTKSVSLVAIEVTPANSSIAPGITHQFTATGIYDDNTKQDITRLVAWNSSSPSVASISDAGLATSLMPGNSTVTATLGSNSGTTSLTVTSAVLISIEVTPSLHRMALRSTQQFTATGIYSDKTTQEINGTITWSSSGVGIATVDQDGMVASIAPGVSTITATSGSVSGMTELTVTSAYLRSIAVTATESPNAELVTAALGTSVQLIATGTYSDDTTDDVSEAVTWSSSSEGKATVNNLGWVKALATGEAIITATLGDKSDQIPLKVTDATLVALEVTAFEPNIALGTTAQFTATGIFSDYSKQSLTKSVLWSSSNTGVAIISNAENTYGLTVPVSVGSITITAVYPGAFGTVTSGTATLTITNAALSSITIVPGDSSIAYGTTAQLTATGTYDDYTKQNLTKLVTWSSNSGRVMVSNAVNSQGVILPGAPGNAIIEATYKDVVGVTSLTITDAILVSIAIAPTSRSIALGTSAYFTATGTYSDNTTQNITNSVTWSSTDSTVATISNAINSRGLTVPLTIGTTEMTATLGAVVGSENLTVTNATLRSIAVTPENPSLALGVTAHFTATGTFSDNTTQNITQLVTWSSSNLGVATVSNAANFHGKAVSVGTGSSNITALLWNISGVTVFTTEP